MATLYSWSPVAMGTGDPLVVANSKGDLWTRSMIDSQFGGDDGAAIQAAIERLSTGVCPAMGDARYNFDPIIYTTRGNCEDDVDLDGDKEVVKDPNHNFAPCHYDASDSELSYVKVQTVDVTAQIGFVYEDQMWSGTVWIYQPVTLLRPLRARRGCTLDFLNNLVTMGADDTFVSVSQGIDFCINAGVRNVRIAPYSTQTQPIIRLNALPGGVFVKRNGEREALPRVAAIQYCTFENIVIGKPGDDQRCFDGIHIFSAGGLTDGVQEGPDAPVRQVPGAWTEWNTFRNIHMYGVRRGIFLEKATWNAGYNNGNIFANIHVVNFQRLVEFKVCLFCEESVKECKDRMGKDAYSAWLGVQPDLFNVFQHVIGDTDGVGADTNSDEKGTDGGFFRIYGGGNRLEHVGLVGWEGISHPEYTADTNRVGGTKAGLGQSYLCAYSLQDPEGQWSEMFYIDAPDPAGLPKERPYADTSESPSCSTSAPDEAPTTSRCGDS